MQALARHPPSPRARQGPGRAAAGAVADASPPAWIRGAVREVLERAPGYRALGEGEQRALAHAMVRVSSLAARLIEEEGDAAADGGARPAPPLARAQSQPEFGAAADRIAHTTRNVLNAVSFPRFVTDLINGVFRAMLDSNQTQMQQYVQLLNAVSASAEGFEGAQFGLMRVRQWLADQFPESIEYDAPEVEPGEAPDPDEVANTRLRLRSGASMPPPEVIRATLGMAPEDPLDASGPEQLVPIARRHLARQRQQMLATMVSMGMQRIVIDSGKINAAMRFHIDTRSAANQDRGSQTNVQNRIKGGGSFGMGPWGASAEMENTVGYVSTQRTQSTEEMNTDLDLNSSVELNFRSDYLPLNQLANQAQADRIRAGTLNPAASAPDDPAAARAARQAAQRAAEEARRAATPIALPAPATGAATPAPGTAAAAPRAPALGTSGSATGAAPGAGTGVGTGAASGVGTSAGTSAASGAAPGTGPGAASGGASGAVATPGSAAVPAPEASGDASPGASRPGAPAPGASAGGGAPTGVAPPGSLPPGPPALAQPTSGTAGGTGAPGAAPASPANPAAPAGPASPGGTPARAPVAAAVAPPAPPGAGAAAGQTAAGVGTQVGATVGGAAGTAAGGAAGGAIGAAIGGVGAVVGAPVGAAVGGAIGTAVGGLLGGAVGGAIDSALAAPAPAPAT